MSSEDRSGIDVTGTEAVLAFYGSGGLGDALIENGFTLREEVTTIVRHIRDNDPKISLGALRQFRTVLDRVSTSDGLIQKITAEQSGEGTTLRISRHGTNPPATLDCLDKVDSVLSDAPPRVIARFHAPLESRAAEPGDEPGPLPADDPA